jgi:hypothetical protein
LTLDNQEIVELIESFERESKALIKHLYTITWHQRGGLTLDEAFQIGHSDRQIIGELIKERTEVTNETKYPYF